MQTHYPLNPGTGLEDAALLPWVNGNPSTGQEGSYPPFGLFTDPMDEILNSELSSGQTPSSSDKTQLAQAISRGVYLGTFGGTANALTAAIPGGVTLPSLAAGMQFNGLIGTANTGAVTLTMTGFTSVPGSKNLLGDDGVALVAGDLLVGSLARLFFDGTAFRLRGLSVPMLKTRLGSPTLTSYQAAGTFTYTVPAGTYRVFVRLVGGGGGAGGGQGGAAYSGGGGGSGGYSEGWVSVTPGQAITVIVGASGAGVNNSNGATGGTGGTTSFGASMSATGGAGGVTGNASSSGGAPGVGSGGTINLYGSAGGDGNMTSASVQGGAGGASAFGGGGRTATFYASSFSNGYAPGSGGGGIWGTGSATQTGGSGAPGAVFISVP